MTTAELSSHRSAMADMRIAHITLPAEHRMKAQSAKEQLRCALAESHSLGQTPSQYVGSSQRNLELCKYLIGV